MSEHPAEASGEIPDGFIDAQARREFFQASFAVLLFSITQNYSSLLAVAFAQLEHSVPTIGLILALFAVPTLLTALMSSAVCARIGVVPTIRIAMALTSLGFVSLAWTGADFWLAILSRTVQGFGVGLLLPSAMTYVQSRLTRTRFVYFVTAHSAMIPLATAIAPPLGEWTLQHYSPFVFFVTAPLWSLFGIVASIGLRDMPRPRAAATAGRRFTLQRRHMLPLLAVIVGGGLYGFVIAWLSPDMQHRGIPVAAFFVPSTVALLVSRLGAMRRLQAVPPRILVSGGLVLTALGLVFSAVASGWPVAALAGLTLGAGNSVMFPVVAAWMSEGLAPAERAGAQAVTSSAFYFGIYATPWPLAFAVGSLGFTGTEISLAALACIVAAVLARPARAT